MKITNNSYSPIMTLANALFAERGCFATKHFTATDSKLIVFDTHSYFLNTKQEDMNIHLHYILANVWSGLIHDPSETIQDASETIHEPSDYIHEPSEAIHDSSDCTQEPSEAIHDSSESIHEPSELIHDTSDYTHEPSESIQEPSESIQEPSEYINHMYISDITVFINKFNLKNYKL